MNYRDEMTRAMNLLNTQSNTLFIGQSVKYKGTAMFGTLKDIPMDKRIELPVMEDSQMGVAIGLALVGFIPISLYPRMDFLICAMNQLVNHLDKIESLSEGRFKPKVIIRTSVGSRTPLDPGLQHIGNYYEPLKLMLSNINLYYLDDTQKVYTSYQQALESDKSSILIELGELYD